MKDKIYREVSVTDRLLLKNKGVIGICDSADGLQQFYFQDGKFVDPVDDYPMPVTAWLEEITLDHIQDKRELTATFLVNSIRLLDEQGARHLVNELIERFHLLPTKEEINKVRDSYSWSHINPIFKDSWRFAVKYILESLKGVSND